MAGYADRGPAPKRSDDRIRTAPGTVETKKLFVDRLISNEVEIPAADPHWHEVAVLFWENAVSSAQNVFYEPSDWAALYVTCEAMSRELADQVVAIVPAVVSNDGEILKDPEVKWGKVPIKGATLNALKSMWTNLLVTEVDRRRAGIEIVRVVQNEDTTEASEAKTVDNVTQIESHRKQVTGNA